MNVQKNFKKYFWMTYVWELIKETALLGDPSPPLPSTIAHQTQNSSGGGEAAIFIGSYDPRQTCSHQQGDGHSDMAWRSGLVDHSGFINTGTLTVNPGRDPHHHPSRSPSRTSGERPPATACEGQSAIKGIRFHGLRQRDWRPPTPLRAINFTLSWQAEGPVTELP